MIGPPRLRGCAAAALVVAALLSTACGGGTEVPAPPVPPPPVPAPTAPVQDVAGRFVVKLHSTGGTGDGWVALAERPRPPENQTAPDRELLLSQPAPLPPRRVAGPPGESLVDVARHPSGELSVVWAGPDAVRLQRLDAAGRVLADSPFLDPAAAADPFYGAAGESAPPAGAVLVPAASRDTLRLAASGEEVVLVRRTARWAVVAQGLRHADGRWQVRWRTLVEPGAPIEGTGLTSGTFDPIGSLDRPWQVHVDVGDDGQIAVATGVAATGLPAAHARHFGEAIDPGLAQGALVTRLSPDGRRLGTTVVDTGARSELHRLRRIGSQVVLVGRIRPVVRADGFSWDGWAAWIDARDGRLQQQRTLDVDRGDVLFDVAAHPAGGWWLAGATGYWQNPGGASVSAEAQPLLLWLAAAHGAPQRLALPGGPGHHQARALAGAGAQTWVGGMARGPGTHSADGDPSRRVADGYVRALDRPGG